ncbi:MAG: nucleotidyltransferase family protein [bacterium]|nr:nucleotidyltransferase family protein [bacterium]
MSDVNAHSIHINNSIHQAMQQLEVLSPVLILFAVDDDNRLKGVLTDGDIRRFLTNGGSMQNDISTAINDHFLALIEDQYSIQDILSIKEKQIDFVPVINSKNQLVDILNLKTHKSRLPLQAVIMAGGKGERLLPLTENTPKPLLKVGNKAIIQYNVDLLNQYGIKKIVITINYLGSLIRQYFDTTHQNDQVFMVEEPAPLGTIGSLALAKKHLTKDVLLMNSDLLTNIDLEAFYSHFIDQGADIAVACIPYNVEIPYGVMETENHQIKTVKEKPTYTYYSNAGIYLIKHDLLNSIRENERLDATTFIENSIANGKKVVSYPLLSYWLDIGKHEDFQKAQTDVLQLLR